MPDDDLYDIPPAADALAIEFDRHEPLTVERMLKLKGLLHAVGEPSQCTCRIRPGMVCRCGQMTSSSARVR